MRAAASGIMSGQHTQVCTFKFENGCIKTLLKSWYRNWSILPYSSQTLLFISNNTLHKDKPCNSNRGPADPLIRHVSKLCIKQTVSSCRLQSPALTPLIHTKIKLHTGCHLRVEFMYNNRRSLLNDNSQHCLSGARLFYWWFFSLFKEDGGSWNNQGNSQGNKQARMWPSMSWMDLSTPDSEYAIINERYPSKYISSSEWNDGWPMILQLIIFSFHCYKETNLKNQTQPLINCAQ